MLVAPAVIAATNMSPDRRVSCPTTSEAPGPPTWWAVARPRANASDGRRSTLAAPRMPSVPNRRVMQGPRAGGWACRAGAGSGSRRRLGRQGGLRRTDGSGEGVGGGVGVGRSVTVIVIASGEMAATVMAEGRDGTTATSWTPGSRSATLSEMTMGDESRRSRSAVEPNSVSSTCRSDASYWNAAARPSRRMPAR